METETIKEEMPSGGMGNGAGITLKVTARDAEGNIVEERCKDGDLFLKNWGLLVAGFFKYGFNQLGAKKYNFMKEDGLTSQIGDAVYWYQCTTGGNWTNTGRILLGSSNVPPKITDYALGNLVKTVVPNLPQLTNSGNVLKIIFTGTASFDVQTIVSEVGIRINSPFAPGVYLLITRDIFDAVTVDAGGTLTVQFEIWFNGMPA